MHSSMPGIFHGKTHGPVPDGSSTCQATASRTADRDAVAIADALAAEGVTINAVVIDGASPDPVSYYANNVIAGSGSFMVIARDFNDYTRAIREKLGRELAPAYARK